MLQSSGISQYINCRSKRELEKKVKKQIIVVLLSEKSLVL